MGRLAGQLTIQQFCGEPKDVEGIRLTPLAKIYVGGRVVDSRSKFGDKEIQILHSNLAFIQVVRQSSKRFLPFQAFTLTGRLANDGR
jgi:hypothetical protein